MISIYTSAFNVVENNFDYQQAIHNFATIGHEVVVAVNSSKDKSLEVISDYAKKFNNVKVIATDYKYDDPWLDGKIKNAALQSTTADLKVGLDLDERIPLYQKWHWYEMGRFLLSSYYDAFLIPSVNLFEDEEHYFSIGQKWYMHKRGLFRGPVKFARQEDGTVDINKSDTCELIDLNGNLVSSMKLSLSNLYVFHLGYMSIDDRVLRNKNFWKKNWSVEAGRDVDIPLDGDSVRRDKIKKKHHLPLWYEEKI